MYVEELLYQRGLTMNDLCVRINELVPLNGLIYADSAEPKSIEELYRHGLNALPSDKSVWDGIVKVKQFPLYIHQGSSNLISEISGYKWRKDKNDNVMEEPVKDKDHLLDAMRYAIHTHTITVRRQAWVA